MGGQDESEGPTFPLEMTTNADEVVNMSSVYLNACVSVLL